MDGRSDLDNGTPSPRPFRTLSESVRTPHFYSRSWVTLCPLLLVGELDTRWAALYAFGNIFVAWALVHHLAFFGKAPAADHGELIVVYLGAMLTLAIMGGGAFSSTIYFLQISGRATDFRSSHTPRRFSKSISRFGLSFGFERKGAASLFRCTRH